MPIYFSISFKILADKVSDGRKCVTLRKVRKIPKKKGDKIALKDIRTCKKNTPLLLKKNGNTDECEVLNDIAVYIAISGDKIAWGSTPEIKNWENCFHTRKAPPHCFFFEELAKLNGFYSGAEMAVFFKKKHPKEGVLILQIIQFAPCEHVKNFLNEVEKTYL